MITYQGKKKSEKHHWWPESVSQHWKNHEGKVNWLLPNGEVRKAPPKQFGAIGNGHYIKLGRKPGEDTIWDQNFEPTFDKADSSFSLLLEWLKSLNQINKSDSRFLSDRFIPQPSTDEQIVNLVEVIVSLAIRSPKNRESAVSVAERLRGNLSERERNNLIALNMRSCHQRAVSLIGTRGKFVVIYSPDQEFIFGDGFFHNILSPVQFSLHSPKILVPLTPEISVLYVRPMQYTTEPRLFTLTITANEAISLNDVVQIYSRQMVFFRSQKPEIIPAYSCQEHRMFPDKANSADILISAIPGVISNQEIFFS